MTNVVTYAKNARQCFCQIKFDSGERVLISIAGPPQAGVKIIKLLFGGIPIGTIWEVTAATAGSFDNYVRVLNRMFPEVKHPLDSIRDCLLECQSISEAKHRLLSIQQGISQGADA